MTPLHTGAAPRWLDGLGEFADGCRRWVFDQWGVLHDGVTAYPGAAEVLRRLKARGDRIVVLGNSGKRAAYNWQRLERLGFGRDCIDALLTSGEQAHRMLAERSDPFFAALGTRCRVISNDGDLSVIEGLPIEPVAHVRDADFLLLAGDDGAPTATHLDAEFVPAAARDLPALCVNPDFVRIDGGTRRINCGALARRYEQLGGRVRWIGKPHPEVYAGCAALLGADADGPTVMVGDSLRHDVAGAQAAGWASVLVTGGVHADRLHGQPSRAHALAALQVLVGEAGLARAPDAIIDELVW